MTTKETNELIAAYKSALKAKDQTIQLLLDLVNSGLAPAASHGAHDLPPDKAEIEDWELAAEQAAAAAMRKQNESEEERARFVPGGSHPLSIDDDAEDLAAMVEAGQLPVEDYERALAQIQALNTTIEVT